jgi:hypothetical protein
MKRLISIPVMVLILFSGININIASHYCGGRLAATRVSLTGEAASCGMEELPFVNTPNGLITRHCCDNVISSFSMGLNYVPSAYVSLPSDGHHLNVPYSLQGEVFISQAKILSFSVNIRKPPGSFNPSDVEQQSICIFRI